MAEVGADGREPDQPLRLWIHDLRSSLTGVLGYAQLLSETDDIEKVREWSAKILAASESLNDTVNAMAEDFGIVPPSS